MASYKAPSDLKPAIAVLTVASIYPSILAYHVLSDPSGLQSLTFARLTIFLIVEASLLRYHTIPHFTTPLRCLPRPSNERFIRGNAKEMLTRPPIESVTEWQRTVPNDGLIFIRTFLHFTWHVMLTSPAALTEVLGTKAYDFTKPPISRKFLIRVLGDGLIVSEGATHKRQRKSVAPAFQGRHVRELVPLFWAKAQQMVEVIAQGKVPDSKVICKEAGRREVEVEIGAVASRATLDIIGKAAMGRDFNTLENSNDELARQYDIILDPNKEHLTLYFVVNLALPYWLSSRLPWKQNQRINAAAINLHDICRQLVNDRKEELEREKEQGLEKGSARVDILSVLLRNNELNNDELVDQMLTFLAAGHETTSSALTWVSYLLSANPDIQMRLRKELQSSPLASSDTTASADILDALPLLQAICAETLRLYPTVPLTARVANRDTTIQGQFIPKGVELLICPWTTNRDKAVWGEDADDFNPDRWLTEGGIARMNGYDFITFLHGPRSCIGQGFARWELASLLAKMVMTFDLRLADGWENKTPIPAGAVTIKPRDGMRLVLTEIAT